MGQARLCLRRRAHCDQPRKEKHNGSGEALPTPSCPLRPTKKGKAQWVRRGFAYAVVPTATNQERKSTMGQARLCLRRRAHCDQPRKEKHNGSGEALPTPSCPLRPTKKGKAQWVRRGFAYAVVPIATNQERKSTMGQARLCLRRRAHCDQPRKEKHNGSGEALPTPSCPLRPTKKGKAQWVRRGFAYAVVPTATNQERKSTMGQARLCLRRRAHCSWSLDPISGRITHQIRHKLETPQLPENNLGSYGKSKLWGLRPQAPRGIKRFKPSLLPAFREQQGGKKKGEEWGLFAPKPLTRNNVPGPDQFGAAHVRHDTTWAVTFFTWSQRARRGIPPDPLRPVPRPYQF